MDSSFSKLVYFYLHPSLIFAGKTERPALEWSRVRGSTRLGSSLAHNISFGWKWLTVTNALAYYGVEVLGYKHQVPVL
jgi:hypothetical protein